MRNDKNYILVVDDDPMTCKIVENFLKKNDYEVTSILEGTEALPFVTENHKDIDTIILDRGLPNMDGLDLVRQLKEDKRTKAIPIIMQTASDSPEEIRQGIAAGVYYYLVKPFNTEIFTSVLEAAVKENAHRRLLDKELSQYGASFSLIDSCNLSYRTIEEAKILAPFLASCYPEQNQVISGIAALLINAVEHGLCNIGHEKKGQLIEQNTLPEEIDRRLALPENRNRKIFVTFRRDSEELFLNIRDGGEGFDWKKYLQIEPSRSMGSHGRGVGLAAAISFDRLVYNEQGNEVSAYIRLDQPLDW